MTTTKQAVPEAPEAAPGAKKPEKKFRSGSVSATIWKNEYKYEGKDMVTHSITIERNYKDKADAWQTTSSFNTNDLSDVAVVAEESRKYLRLKEQ